MINLGIIGLSEGNGHPYSWSAIFNGYNKEEMKNCGFPSIPDYLSKQNLPSVCLTQARVTHIWTQDTCLSWHVAKSCFIDNVVSDPREMLGNIDALLLARDDSKNHLLYARPFIDFGLPVYVDKPLALSLYDANKILSFEKYPGQIFTCSALRYANEFIQLLNNLCTTKNDLLIRGSVPNSWEQYAIHVIEPIISQISGKGVILNSSVLHVGVFRQLTVIYNSGLTLEISSLGKRLSPIEIEVHEGSSLKKAIFNDPFSAFKKALEQFILGIQNRSFQIPRQETLEIISLVEMGLTASNIVTSIE